MKSSKLFLVVFSLIFLGATLLQTAAVLGQQTKDKRKLKDLQQRAGQRAQQRATHTQEQIRPVRASATRVLPISRWTTKYHDSAVWETTSRSSDLDNDVRLGAKILKYRDGRYVQTLHRQYPSTCGPATLAMVLKQLGITGGQIKKQPRRGASTRVSTRNRPLLVRRDVDNLGTETVNVGYRGSMEHLMWLGYHRHRLNLDMTHWNDGDDQFMSTDGMLNTSDTGVLRSRLAVGNDMNYLPFTHVPSWMWNAPGTGCGASRDYFSGLPGIMNYNFSGGKTGPWRDARPLYLLGRNDAEVIAARRVIKGFIDHNISVVAGVESGGHFNAVIGYRGQVSPASADFWVYTADPLNGWGRSDDTRQPGTWRRILVNQENLLADKKLFMAMIVWNHHADGNASVNFRPGNWARQVDNLNGNKWLTGAAWQPHSRDPLNDTLARSAERMPARPTGK